jgi:predicted secreted protein
MTEAEEAAYVLGRKAMARDVLAWAIQELGPEAPDVARMAAERADVVAYLRTACADHGDNQWSDDLHLRDVIEKHLVRHIEAA